MREQTNFRLPTDDLINFKTIINFKSIQALWPVIMKFGILWVFFMLLMTYNCEIVSKNWKCRYGLLGERRDAIFECLIPLPPPPPPPSYAELQERLF